MRYLILLTLQIFCVTALQAQDDKRIASLSKDLTKGDYSGLLRHLEKMPEATKNSPDAFYLSAVANDSLHNYETALAIYKRFEESGSTTHQVNPRIVQLEEGLTERKECKVCFGKGYTIKESRCGNCQGSGLAKTACGSCNGTKYIDCVDCSGTGKVQNSQGSYIPCQKCYGKGKSDCTRCNMTGVLEDNCKYCKSGVIRTQIPCTLHL